MNSRQKVVHILGGGQWQMPTIHLAKSLGYRVLVTDMYEERPAYLIADAHEVIDITDMNATLNVARRHRVDGILCDTTDVGVPTAAYVAEKMGLPGIGYQTACNFTNKLIMRQITSRAGVSPVRFRLVESAEQMSEAGEELGYPFIVKPADNQSSRGVHRVDHQGSAQSCYTDASRFTRSGTVLAEEFLPGIECTVEGLCLDGHYFTLGISDKDHFAHRLEIANRLTYPARFDADLMEKIRATNESVVAALGLRNGVTHAEYMVHQGQVRLVEIAARGGGSRIYSHIAPYLSGIDVPKLYLEFLTGGHPTASPNVADRAANLQFFFFGGGRVKAIEGVDDAQRLPGVQEILLEFGVGDWLHPPEDDRSRPGLTVVFGISRDQVLETSALVKQMVKVVFH